MFRPGRPLLSGQTIHGLQQLARDGFATAMAMSKVTVTVVRENPNTHEMEDIGVREAVVGYDASSAGQGVGGDSTAIVPTSGMIRAFAPWDIQLGDRVRLDSGDVLIITAPAPYERFGVVRARWRAEEGTP